MKTTTLLLKTSRNRSSCPLALLLTPLVLAWFALSPQARAVCQEGCDTINANTFLGDDALVNNTTGTGNTAAGSRALFSNTTGIGNTATGLNALFSNTAGNMNTAIGGGTLADNTLGAFNTATGHDALTLNTTGKLNTANGALALFDNTTGSHNTAVGNFALRDNRTGSQNTAIGSSALHHSRNGSSNIALGNAAGNKLTAGNDNIYIGNAGQLTESNTIRIGTTGIQTATFIAGISGATVPTGVAVIVDADGHLGTTTSCARFKEAIRPMDKVSEAILALKPVTFRYKQQLDPDGIPQFGLVAEEVEKVNPDLVARDDHGKPYTVRYDAVNAMLLNEFLKEHRRVQELETGMTALIARLKEQESKIQKVSDQLQTSKPAPQMVGNNQ